jgi:hypothetical protein
MTQTYLDKDGVARQDRRQHHHLRTQFDGIRALLEPFMQSSNGWGDAELSYLAKRRVQEAFPELDALEVHTLMNAVLRVMRAESKA